MTWKSKGVLEDVREVLYAEAAMSRQREVVGVDERAQVGKGNDFPRMQLRLQTADLIDMDAGGLARK